MVITLSTFVFLVMMGLSLISPVLPLYAMSFGASVFMVSLLVAAFAVSRMLLDLPAGLLGSRYHPKSLMLFGLALISSSSILCALAPNYWMLLLGRIIEGAGSGFACSHEGARLRPASPWPPRRPCCRTPGRR